jgi:acetoin:2,6-dichlorophenolindophenol oxidoreductase subunit beta
VVTRVAEAGALRHRPVRIAVPDTRIPAAPELAGALIPDTARIGAALTSLAV